MALEFNKRIFTMKEHIRIMKHAAKSLGLLMYVKKHKLFNKKFKERIMLAVTEVNGCELCSYVHTKISLSSGMSSSEIREILNGVKDDIPEDELVGVLFAEYYATSHELPEKEMVNRLIEEYGRDKSKIICSILGMITLTNSMGISLGLFKDRLKFKRVKKSKLLNELGIPLLTMTLFPLLFLYYKIKSFFKTPSCHLIPDPV
jgi:AhpD family alkylhydroperoxidase